MISHTKKYLGNKNIPGVYHKIINEIPKCMYFIELFAGSGAVSERIGPVQTKIILNDISKKCCAVLEKKFRSHTVINAHFEDALKSFLAFPPGDTVIFADPPYLHETRAINFDKYDFEMTEHDHVQLLNSLLEYSHKVMIIHPKHELYETMLKDWRKIEIKIRYHSKTSVEYLYMNFPAEEQLITYKFLGTDCWDRQRIKRKAERILQKLKTLPAAERNFILQRIKEINN